MNYRYLPALVCALLAPLSSAAGASPIRWNAEGNTLPEEANPLFAANPDSASPEQKAKWITLKENALVITTEDDESAWYTFQGGALDEEQAISVDIEAMASPSTGPAGINISQGEKGVFLFLWNGTHLRVKLDDAEPSYLPVKADEFHHYKIDLKGRSVTVSIDGSEVFQGSLGEPLPAFMLQFGDSTYGGGEMQIKSISIDGVETSGGSTPVKTPAGKKTGWIRATGDARGLRIANTALPEKADALVVDSEYRAATPRQAQLFLRFDTPNGEKLAALSTGLASAATNDYCKEQFFVKLPAGATTVSLEHSSAPSKVPFQLRRLSILPVRLLSEFSQPQRLSGVTQESFGQSFSNPERRSLSGICVPMSREFDASQFPGELTCRLYSEGVEVGSQKVNARHIPLGLDGYAVFTFDKPVPIGSRAHFTISSGFGDPPYYGWYSFHYASGDPYKAGSYMHGNTTEPDWDMTFFAFSEVDTD